MYEIGRITGRIGVIAVSKLLETTNKIVGRVVKNWRFPLALHDVIWACALKMPIVG
jgi:hypothetical protein